MQALTAGEFYCGSSSACATDKVQARSKESQTKRPKSDGPSVAESVSEDEPFARCSQPRLCC